MAKNDFNYTQKRAELDELLAWFERGDVSVDEAIDKYQQAEKLLAELEAYLADTQAKVEVLTKKYAKGD
ncbi:MAG: exodeoxyribonuclease VII small subunit [Candidatus Saccharimonadales bacterium]